ncbi:MAG: hypothetical protein AB8G18_05875 [Gammaproteobacteria bacterium]
MRVWGLLLVAALCLNACGSGDTQLHTYQIVVNGSTTPIPVEFTGSYACENAGSERIHDISGSGTMSASFECERLLHVRIQRVLGAGLVSLTVYKNGEAVFATPSTSSVAPIVYVPEADNS